MAGQVLFKYFMDLRRVEFKHAIVEATCKGISRYPNIRSLNLVTWILIKILLFISSTTLRLTKSFAVIGYPSGRDGTILAY